MMASVGFDVSPNLALIGAQDLSVLVVPTDLLRFLSF